jgi:hypothetical protein
MGQVASTTRGFLIAGGDELQSGAVNNTIEFVYFYK